MPFIPVSFNTRALARVSFLFLSFFFLILLAGSLRKYISGSRATELKSRSFFSCCCCCCCFPSPTPLNLSLVLQLDESLLSFLFNSGREGKERKEIKNKKMKKNRKKRERAERNEIILFRVSELEGSVFSLLPVYGTFRGIDGAGGEARATL